MASMFFPFVWETVHRLEVLNRFEQCFCTSSSPEENGSGPMSGNCCRKP